VYLPFGGAATLDLEGHVEPFRISWFDARNGGALQDGAVTLVSGPGSVSLGSPPGAGDWVAFVRRVENLAPLVESLEVEPHPFQGGRDFALKVHARDPNGPSDPLSATAEFHDPSGNPIALLPLTPRGGTLHSLFLRNAPSLAAGTWQVTVTVEDAGGLKATQTASFEAL
jgi:hypothetical protein